MMFNNFEEEVYGRADSSVSVLSLSSNERIMRGQGRFIADRHHEDEVCGSAHCACDRAEDSPTDPVC